MSDVEIRQAKLSDIPHLLELQVACYPTLAKYSLWRAAHLEAHQRNFPDGQFVADVDGTLVGHCATFLARSDMALQPHTFREITALGTFDLHDPRGDTLYGAEIMVHPDYRRRGIGKKFYQARFDLAQRLNLRYFAAGGRIPGFVGHQQEMSADEYVKAVASGRLTDRVLSAQIKSGLQAVGVMPNYLNDPNSAGFASILMWENPKWRAPAAAGAAMHAAPAPPGKG